MYACTSVQKPKTFRRSLLQQAGLFDDLLLGSGGAKGHGDMGRRSFNLQTQKKLTQPF